ncbi:putative ribonuclease H protein [Vitis vinifera]|uniref:Putative ribonuclease H protein n=1 Tax=Vitis vinifera TaxID=29760 RepID=A0A438H891_VITVI|nr:putative ribonuclease H protein [Vitis vinifera]
MEVLDEGVLVFGKFCSVSEWYSQRASVDDFQNLKLILLIFGILSRLKININKSTLCGINTSHDQISKLALMLGCTVSNWPLMYLGLPLGGNPKSISFWDPVIDRVSRRLDGWKKGFFITRGGGTLILSCLSHIPSYFLSLFKIPASIASRIEKMQRDFLWSRYKEGKKDHLINWGQVCGLKEFGGSGFGKISLWNHALLGKWLWRFPKERFWELHQRQDTLEDSLLHFDLDGVARET